MRLGGNMERRFPDPETLKKMRKKLMKGPWSASMPPNASRTEKFKYELCKRLLIIMRTRGLSQRDLAKRLGINESRVSEMTHYKIGRVSIEKLMQYLEKVDDTVEFRVA